MSHTFIFDPHGVAPSSQADRYQSFPEEPHTNFTGLGEWAVVSTYRLDGREWSKVTYFDSCWEAMDTARLDMDIMFAGDPCFRSRAVSTAFHRLA
jgi:hypothetical protein